MDIASFLTWWYLYIPTSSVWRFQLLLILILFLIKSSLSAWGFPGGSDSKASAWNAGDPGLIPGSGRSLGEGNDYLLQYSCLENSMDRGAWRATVHGVSEESDVTEHIAHIYINESKKWMWVDTVLNRIVEEYLVKSDTTELDTKGKGSEKTPCFLAVVHDNQNQRRSR